MRAFGADVELLPSPEGITPDAHPADAGARRRDRSRDGRVPDRPVQQHRHDRRLPRARAGAVRPGSMVGSTRSASMSEPAGCFLGTTRALRERLPELQRVAVEPAESAVLSGSPAGTHRIEGGGVGFVPPLLSARRDRRGHRRPDRRCVRDGAPGRARGRRLVGTIDGRQHQAALVARPTARRGRASRDDPGRFRA